VKDDRLYLIHVLECVERIQSYIKGGKSRFDKDTKTQDAVIRNLQILAESTKRMSKRLKDQHPKIDWNGMVGFRNILVHDYLGVDVDRVWEIVSHDLPLIKRQFQSIAGKIKRPS